MNYTLPDRYTVRQLIHAYHHFRNNPDDRWVAQVNKWMGHHEPASAWFRWFMDKLDDKITSKMNPCGKGNRADRRRGRSIRHECPADGCVYVIPSGLGTWA